MTRGSDRDSTATGRTEDRLKGVQRLASKLQRAVNTGRASRLDMRHVDRFLSRYLSEQAVSILQDVDLVLSKTTHIDRKEKLTRLYIVLMDIFSQFKSMENFGYAELLKPDRTVKPKKLNSLIDIDSEIAFKVTSLGKYVSNIVRRKNFSEEDYGESICMVEELTSALQNRKHLVTRNV